MGPPLASRKTRLPLSTVAKATIFLLLSQWHDAAATAENIAWAREGFATVEPFFASARYVNYLDQDDAADVMGAFGANYARLAQIKAKWDPGNVFHLNQNIQPAND